ncbi:hypothetical protein [Peribacillus sp. SCS-37]|uniref:hypothetical protein n=1 Tax=Paraperibacillus esterisolvens TaxID=3115296 RepID=UPI0039060424
MNTERLNMIKDYYAKQEKVKVEIPYVISETNKGKVIHRFNGRRAGYDFINGIATVERKDLHLFRKQFPHVIIHDEEGGE